MALSSTKINPLYSTTIFLLINLAGIIFIILPKLNSVYTVEAGEVEHISIWLEFGLQILFAGLLFGAPFFVHSLNKSTDTFVDVRVLNILCLSSVLACLIAIFGGFYTDMYFLLEVAKLNQSDSLFATNISAYFEDTWIYYLIWMLLFSGIIIYYKTMFKINLVKINDKLLYFTCFILAIILPVAIITPLTLMNVSQISYFNTGNYLPLPTYILLAQNVIYMALSSTLMIVSFNIRKRTKEHLAFLKKLIQISGAFTGFALLFEVVSSFYPYKLLIKMGAILPKQGLTLTGAGMRENWLALLLLLGFTFAILGFRKYIKQIQFDDLSNEDNAGTEHGGSKWASTEDIKSYGYYDPADKLYAATDEIGQPMYFPLVNRTVLAPPGGGKTSSVAITLGLLYNGPICMTDFKAELWAVFARHRYEVFKRKQILLDPFNITQFPEFQYKADMTKKPDELFKKWRINPFHSIPEEPELRQRVLSALAESFIIRDEGGGATTHFYDNAEILIKGMIDYVIKTIPRELQNFTQLLRISQTTTDKLSDLIKDMVVQGGESENAAGMLDKLGIEERGSLFSTTGRQLAWLTDINMQDCLKESNFSIDEIIKGNADIYIVLPADTAKTHGRFIRMIIALVRGSLIRLRPSELPKKKIVFLLDELAQLGKSPDIEQAIEIFRSYGVVVWAIFQYLSQIKIFDKPDVFTNAPTLQIFTNSDNDTMKFIQDKFSKTTILQKTLSNNKGDQRQKNQVWGGSVSAGEGESVQSSGVEMVHFDQIREMPNDEQWFLVGNGRPIKAKKLPYFEDRFFADCQYDPNPTVDREFAEKVAAHDALNSVQKPNQNISIIVGEAEVAVNVQSNEAESIS